MAMKIDRRAFLKTSAAMAVAVSMTGLLGGCSGGDGGTDLGGFTVAVGKWSAVPHDQRIGILTSIFFRIGLGIAFQNLNALHIIITIPDYLYSIIAVIAAVPVGRHFDGIIQGYSGPGHVSVNIIGSI